MKKISDLSLIEQIAYEKAVRDTIDAMPAGYHEKKEIKPDEIQWVIEQVVRAVLAVVFLKGK